MPLHYLTLFFRGRRKPINVPVTEKCADTVQGYLRERAKYQGFFEFASIVEHDIWVNPAHLQMVRILFEPQEEPPFDLRLIRPSKQDLSVESGLDDVKWDVTFWLSGRNKPVNAWDVSCHHWVEIYSCCQNADESFFAITDEDDEELLLRVDDIQMISGVEDNRYSDEQRDAVKRVFTSNYEPIRPKPGTDLN